MERVPFTLAQLEYFVAVADLGSFSDAAGHLAVAQSTVSTAVAQLERVLRCQLLVRKQGRGATLTEAGRALLPDAQRLLATARSVHVATSELQNRVVGTLDVGCFTTIAPMGVPPVLARIRTLYPDLQVNVREADIDGLVGLLTAGEIEVALTYDLDLPATLEFTLIRSHRPYALVAENHRFGGAERASLKDLARDPMVFLDVADTARYMNRVLAKAGAFPPAYHRVTSFETLRGLVGSGAGFAIITQRVRTDETYGGGRVHALEISDPVPEVPVGLYWPSAHRATRRARVFAAVCREVLGPDHA